MADNLESAAGASKKYTILSYDTLGGVPEIFGGGNPRTESTRAPLFDSVQKAEEHLEANLRYAMANQISRVEIVPMDFGKFSSQRFGAPVKTLHLGWFEKVGR